jgi:hypothetical protein
VTWKEMQGEIILDIAKIVAVDQNAEYIVAEKKWENK